MLLLLLSNFIIDNCIYLKMMDPNAIYQDKYSLLCIILYRIGKVFRDDIWSKDISYTIDSKVRNFATIVV